MKTHSSYRWATRTWAAGRQKYPPCAIITCFEWQLILLLAVVIIESADTDSFAGAGIILKWIPVSTVFIARVGGGLLVIGPLGRVGLVFIIAAHTDGRKTEGKKRKKSSNVLVKSETKAEF